MAEPALPPLVYPDTSVLGRLTDAAPELAQEAAAVRRLFRMIAEGRLRLLSSEVLRIEVQQAAPAVRRRRLPLLRMATVEVPIVGTEAVAQQLTAIGFQANDALHLAAAFVGGADYALSYDRAHWLRRRARVASLLGPRPVIMTPIECLQQEGLA